MSSQSFIHTHIRALMAAELPATGLATEFKAQCLAQRHFDMLTGGARDRAAKPIINE